MAIEQDDVTRMYQNKTANKYDKFKFFGKFKALSFGESSLKTGDSVVVFCCGTGSDFHHIIKRIGPQGRIVGVDISAEMLNIARAKISENGWKNIELVQADVSSFKDVNGIKFDVGVCNLGFSIIPDYKSAFSNLCANVKKGGQIVIGDVQLIRGLFSFLNYIIIFSAREFGATHQGYKNALDLFDIMKSELVDVKKREFLLKSYFYCIGFVK